jgi:pimeloyl-ACP methyl ester carboxylesterase
MSDWPADVAELADILDISRFFVAGHSAGGPYALACAAELQERVSGALILGGVTDMAWPDAWVGYSQSEVSIMRTETEDAAVVLCNELFGPDGSGFFAASGFELSEPDEELYADPDVASLLSESRIEAFRQGVLGYAQDVFVQGRARPFDVKRITAPVRILHGEMDNLLSTAHSQHTAERIPGAKLHILPGHGHLSILSELSAVASYI